MPQTQFLTVVEWLELDELEQEASSGRWGGEDGARSDYCGYGTDDSTDWWTVKHSWERHGASLASSGC